MIDIHSHLLPGVDDGCQSLEESLSLLKGAIQEGIEYVVITPHFMKNGAFKLSRDEIVKRFIEFKKIVKDKGLDIELLLGNELYIHSSLDKLLLDKQVCSLNNTRYVLVEFPFEKYLDEYDEALYNIACSGYKVIIAHPERYAYVKDDINFVNRWIKEGYLLQCNQNSLFNANQKTVFRLIEKNYVSFIASDAHNEYRPCSLLKAYQKVKKQFGEITADKLFEDNALNMLQNREV